MITDLLNSAAVLAASGVWKEQSSDGGAASSR
jgi:hypothetical protein